VPGPGLEDHLQQGLGVEVVKADRLADPSLHQDLCAEVAEMLLGRVRLGRRRAHHGDVMQALAVSVEPFLIYARSLVRLQELDHDRADMGLGADHREVGRLAVQERVMKRGWLVLVYVPRAPPERPVISLERLVDVANDNCDLADRKSTCWNGHLLGLFAVTVGVALHRYLPTKLQSG